MIPSCATAAGGGVRGDDFREDVFGIPGTRWRQRSKVSNQDAKGGGRVVACESLPSQVARSGRFQDFKTDRACMHMDYGDWRRERWVDGLESYKKVDVWI